MSDDDAIPTLPMPQAFDEYPPQAFDEYPFKIRHSFSVSVETLPLWAVQLGWAFTAWALWRLVRECFA